MDFPRGHEFNGHDLQRIFEFYVRFEFARRFGASRIAKKAKAAGARVVHIGSNPGSEMKDVAEFMVRIPVRTKNYLEDEIDSVQPMTSLFEQSLLILGDTVAKMIIDKKQIDMKSLWKYHANLE